MTRTELTTVEEFYTWAQRQMDQAWSAKWTYKLDIHRLWEDATDAEGNPIPDGEPYEAWNGEMVQRYKQVSVSRYYLDLNDSRSTFAIPQEVGEVLEKVWKRSTYGRFVGNRTLPSILKLMGNGALGEEMLARGKRAQDLEKRKTDAIRRNSFRSDVAKQAQSLRQYVERHAFEPVPDPNSLTLGELIALGEALEVVPTE